MAYRSAAGLASVPAAPGRSLHSAVSYSLEAGLPHMLRITKHSLCGISMEVQPAVPMQTGAGKRQRCPSALT